MENGSAGGGRQGGSQALLSLSAMANGEGGFSVSAVRWLAREQSAIDAGTDADSTTRWSAGRVAPRMEGAL